MRGELFTDRIYALTPKGEVIDLPHGATPLDFAYHVHTGLGHRCRGAKVNGRIVPLNYALKNGEIVEIIVGKDPAPSRDWLRNRRLSRLRAQSRQGTRVVSAASRSALRVLRACRSAAPAVAARTAPRPRRARHRARAAASKSKAWATCRQRSPAAADRPAPRPS